MAPRTECFEKRGWEYEKMWKMIKDGLLIIGSVIGFNIGLLFLDDLLEYGPWWGWLIYVCGIMLIACIGAFIAKRWKDYKDKKRRKD